MKSLKIDKQFFVLTILLLTVGLIIFLSASLGLLARDNIEYSRIVLKQILFGGGIGIIALLFASHLDYNYLRKKAFYIFVGALVLNFLVFIPGLGFEHGGATRWLSIGSFTFQPSELLRLATVIYFAAWLASIKDKVATFKFGLIPLMAVFGITEGVLLLQHDTDLVIASTLIGMFFVAGGKLKHLAYFCIILTVALAALVYTRPYVLSRVTSFLNPSMDSQGSGYQLQQSLITIGSGGFWGRGFGQSVQKFGYLPEPMGDSIFAVEAEEFGFVGALVLILLFLIWSMRGFKIGINSKDSFGGLLAVGITLVVITQAITNIGGMLGVLPLTGVPLPFVSQGGTSLIILLFASGVILNISKHQKLTK